MSEQTAFNAADRTPRLALPFLFPAQAHKEVTHNEALAKINMLIAPIVEGSAAAPDALSLQEGECWLVSDEADGEWAGCAQHIACWSGSGWLFHPPTQGLQVYNRENSAIQFFRGARWRTYPRPADINGGAVIDEQARAAISQLITTLSAIGILQGG